jgi:hypothetical protein
MAPTLVQGALNALEGSGGRLKLGHSIGDGVKLLKQDCLCQKASQSPAQEEDQAPQRGPLVRVLRLLRYHIPQSEPLS